MPKPSFIHLHTHSHYSLLDGLGKTQDLAEKAKTLGMPALGLTDHGVMYGAIDFYQTCKNVGIKPIVGMEAYISPRGMEDKSPGLDTKPYHITLLARNHAGYKNLLKITSAGHLKGYYYKPRVDKDFLAEHAEGLIAFSGCMAAEIPRMILEDDLKKTKELIKYYQNIFGKEHYYLEIQRHEDQNKEQGLINDALIKLSKELKVPLVATNDVHYVETTDREAHDILLCIQTSKTVQDKDRMRYDGNFALRSSEDMHELFKDVPEAVTNTSKIADMCNLELKFGEELLPHFEIPENTDEKTYLRELCEIGLGQRYDQTSPEIIERLEFELKVITKMGYGSYFLIVADFVNFAKSRGILVGPGRGSAAGSLVSYLLGVTNLDPLEYGLLFERFLNPDRISMPDIDMDFADNRRREVIDYVVNKYGKDKVAGVITFGTMAARASIRDTGRALGMTYAEVDRVAKIVPTPIQGRHIQLAVSTKENRDLRAIYETEDSTKQLIDQASKLEGTIRHASQHACAVVISRDPLVEHTPLQLAQGGDIDIITQYSMHPIEDIGLLKMDFLGLANLSVMVRALEIIEAVYGDVIDLDRLPLDDAKTYALLSRGETTGVFQLESSGMKRYIKELKPNRFDDIVVMGSLYRPGPMQFIPNYINRKHGKEEIRYEHPLMESSLKDTYGVIVYQEQVMQMSREMAGFTGGESDTLRMAMGKKIPKLMKQMGEKFVQGCVKNGVPKPTAEKIYQQLLDFSAYAFNKSHAASYAMISFQTAYLKAHYPDCFMAALMTSDYSDSDRITIEVEEYRRMGFEVFPPDVNESFQGFAVVKQTKNIRFGLAAVKNIGMGVADKIVFERKKDGPYKSLEDFLSRTGSEVANKKSMESLVKVGALDAFGERGKLLFNLEIILRSTSSHFKQSNQGQMDLFATSDSSTDIPTLKMVNTEPASSKQRLAWEKELIGIYLSEHPLRPLREELAERTTPISDIAEMPELARVTCAGIITKTKRFTTKNGQTMLFAIVEDLTGSTEVLIFPKVLENDTEIWHDDAQVIINGKLSSKDGETKILVDSAKELTEVSLHKLKALPKQINSSFGVQDSSDVSDQELILNIPKSLAKEDMSKVKSVLLEYPGQARVQIKIKLNGTEKNIVTKTRIDPNKACINKLTYLLGEENVRIKISPR
jgi:DNA polymerase-3 subunit alpha